MSAEKFNGFVFSGSRLDNFDFPRIGASIGVGEDVVHAVIDTETSGKSTDSKGRLKALYEPHKAYEYSSGHVREALVKAGLAYPKWGTKPYPKDSYPRILKAMEIDETVALMSTSWGFPQILGSNYALAGYETVQDMVLDFQRDEDNQLEAMIRFIKNSNLDDELQVLQRKLDRGERITPDDARPFARGYNGRGYAKNGYHTTLARNLNKWGKIPDTEWTPTNEHTVEEIKHYADLYDGAYHPEIQRVQERLDALGYPEVGSFDGKWGSKTRAAVLAFRADNELPLDPVIDETLLAALLVAKPRPVSQSRQNATLDDLRKDGAEDVATADVQQTAGGVAAAGGTVVAVDKILDDGDRYTGLVGRVLDIIDPIKDVIVDNMWILLIGFGIFVVWKSGVLKKIRLQKHKTGNDVSV